MSTRTAAAGWAHQHNIIAGDPDLHHLPHAPDLVKRMICPMCGRVVGCLPSHAMTTIEAPSTELTALSQAAQAFGARMIGIVNDGAIALLCSIGHQTGLFDTLAGLPAATSARSPTPPV